MMDVGKEACGLLDVCDSGARGDGRTDNTAAFQRAIDLNDAKASCLIDLTDAVGATLNGLCLAGAGLGSGVHGVLADKSDYGATEDTPRPVVVGPGCDAATVVVELPKQDGMEPAH